MPRDHALYAYVATIVCVVGIVLLAALHDAIPDVLIAVAGGGLGGGAALSVPTSRRRS